MRVGSVERHDPLLDALVPPAAEIEKLADGFEWSEGPVWSRDGDYLLFSDIPVNTIYRWDRTGGLQVYLRPAGYMWRDAPGLELGTNGLTLDPDGRLVMCDHGNRQIARLDGSTFTKETLADRYDGKRFNSPNDLIYKSNGDLYFTDPPYGLRGLNDDPAKEQPFNGVYRLRPSGEVTLLTTELSFPNGIAFSPDERTLYVANSDPARPIWMAFDVQGDGTLANSRVFFDAARLVQEGKRGMPDGLAVDQGGNLFATGPGGVLIISPEGEHLGTIATGELAANCAFGDDGSTLYITSDPMLVRIRLNTTGLGF
jgi:gluconolactonase